MGFVGAYLLFLKSSGEVLVENCLSHYPIKELFLRFTK